MSTDLVRLFYTSRILGEHRNGLTDIATQSVNNNTRAGITGILLTLDDRYLQVLEGPKAAVDHLLEKLKVDKRHRNMQIHFYESADTLLFDGWALASPLMTDSQMRAALDLLTSEDRTSIDIGLSYLKYWLTTRNIDNTLTGLAKTEGLIRVDEFVQGQERSRKFSIIAFCIAILIAVILDAFFFLRDYLNDLPGSFEMIVAHTVAGSGLVLSVLVAKTRNVGSGVAVFQTTAFFSVALHIFYAGYGMHAPALSYLGLGIISGVIGNHTSGRLTLLLASLLMIAAAVAASLLDPVAVHFLGISPGTLNRPVPAHHTALAGLLFPITCALILDAYRHRYNATQKFSAHILKDLTQTIQGLKRAMTERNYFFSAASHEIRTPMAGAIAAVTLMKHPKADANLKTRSLNSLEQSLSNLDRLLNDLLDISKLEAGRFQLAAEPFNLNEATKTTVDFLQAAAASRGNALEIHVPQQEPILIGDRFRYQQMLSNLLGNANKFTENGRITVTLSQLNPEISPNNATWRCQVSDTGIGIPSEDVKHLFRPFSQASQHGYSKTKGTGLGLSIVLSLAKEMGGEAGVSSTPGVGSTFWFTFTMQVQGVAGKRLSA